VKIEILLTDISRKNEALTRLAGEPGIKAGGGRLEIDGLKLEVGENYLLFTIDRWERAEEIVPLLFSVNPAHSAHTFRPESGLKALVTCRAKAIEDIIPGLASVSHLDLAAGELAGDFQVTWSSHDVAVSARAGLMVQGGLAVAKIKFVTHARDAEYHCRACIELISFKEILKVFCREPLEAPLEPAPGPIVIEGEATVEGNGWLEFFNARPGVPAVYHRGAEELRLTFGPHDYISFRKGKGKAVGVLAHFEDPGALTDDLAAGAAALLGLAEVKVSREIGGLPPDLDRLRRELGFKLEEGPARFVRTGEFTARYDAGRLAAVLTAEAPLDAPVRERLLRIYREMEELTRQLIIYAG